MGGLLSPFGDTLLGQRLAQPGLLVVHGSFPFLPLSRSSGGCQQRVVAGQLRMALDRSPPNPACAIRERLSAPYLWSLTRYGGRSPPAGRGG
jgi:hypothetical protein